MIAWLLACGSPPPVAAPAPTPPPVDPQARAVEEQLVGRGIRSEAVLRAMRTVPRERFVPASLRREAWTDGPLPIGFEQTISQPYIVARMTEALDLSPGERVLEIGTGSGYQAAVLAELGAVVYSIEILEPVAALGARNLADTGYADRVNLRVGDGYLGWPEAAPFDAIVVTAAPEEVPQPLIDQLAPGGVLVAPIGDEVQELWRLTRTDSGVHGEVLELVRFVPMTGEAQR